MSRLLRTSTLSIVFLVLLVGALVGQAFAGWLQFNDQQVGQGMGGIGLGRYLMSADFAVDVTENWQSEYLQFPLCILATVFFMQVGSPESPEQPGLGTDKVQKLGAHVRQDSPSWAKAGGARTVLFVALTLVMASVFLVSWLAQSIAG